jgi:Leucine-rich repeat (LRR) protein
LTSLILADNQLTTLSDGVGNLTGLTFLILSNNQLTSLPDEVGQWQALMTLDLSGNQLTSLPDEVGQWQALTTLNLGGNQLASLPDGARKWRMLTSLNLRVNQLTSLPDGVGQWQALGALNLSGNHLTSLPNEVGQWQALGTVDLSGNQLTLLPDRVGQWQALTTLDLSGNQLTSLPDEVGQWQVLTCLYLSDNQLTSLPDGVGQWQALTELELLRNQLTSVPDGVGQWQALTRLIVRDNQLTSLSDEVGQWKALTVLDLSGNQLTSLPDGVGQWQALMTLNLSRNQLTSLPDGVENLGGLKFLFLSNNQLSSLPNSVGQWQALNTLDLHGNQLTSLPKVIEQLLGANLIELYLSENPLPEELVEVLEDGLPALTEYLSLPKEPLREAKLIFVGEGAAGKSTLLDALLDLPWEEEQEAKRSETLGVSTKQVPLPDSSGTGNLTFNAWDFGGQERYLPTHQLFFTSGAVYLALWNPFARQNDQWRIVAQWIQLVLNRVPDAQVLVVVTPDRNHRTGNPLPIHPDEDRLRAEFGPAIRGVYYIDSRPLNGKQGERMGLAALKRVIVEAAEQLDGVGQPVAVLWSEARRQLLQKDRACLQIGQVYDSTEKLGLKRAATRSMLRVATRLGHLVYYEGKSLLGHTDEVVILQPDHLVKAIGVVQKDSEQNPVDKGLVLVSHIDGLWNEQHPNPENRVPHEFHRAFVGLMNEYEVSYPVYQPGYSAERVLLAQLVPYATPADLEVKWPLTSPWTELSQKCRVINHETGTPTAPVGLMYRLIVRFHRFSLGRQDIREARHWQRGLLLADGEYGQAKITLEDDGTTVQVVVRAVHPQYFLWVLTREIVDVVESFWRSLQCDIYVPCRETCKRGAPGSGWFRVSDLLLAKGAGDTFVRCQHQLGCGQQFEIEQLLQHASAAGVTLPPAQMLAFQNTVLAQVAELLPLLQGVQRRQEWMHVDTRWGMSDLRKHFDAQVGQLGEAVRLQFIKVNTDIQEITDRLLRSLRDESHHGPRLFFLEPIDYSWEQTLRGMYKQKYRITLLCEHSYRAVVALNGEKGPSGIYEIELNEAWLREAGWVLKQVGNMGKVIGQFLTAATAFGNPATMGTATQEAAFLNATGEGMTALGGVWEGETLGRQELATTDGLFNGSRKTLNLLHAEMKRQDDQKVMRERFGGLQPVEYKMKGNVRWVHPQFMSEPEYTC